jgi:hypothetical protein
MCELKVKTGLRITLTGTGSQRTIAYFNARRLVNGTIINSTTLVNSYCQQITYNKGKLEEQILT